MNRSLAIVWGVSDQLEVLASGAINQARRWQ